MIYTSYFSNWRNFPKNFKTVSISRFNQKWIKVDYHEITLAPSVDILMKYKNNEISEEEYDNLYLKELEKLDPKEIEKKYQNSIFLCYEKEGEFCHRNILRKWLNKNKVEIKEL